MPGDQWESQLTEGARSLEVRWIFPGPMATAAAGWFGRFPAETESREDTYLLDPRWRGLSVKVRGGTTLEVKMFQGSPGILEVTGRARGRMESWQKWSFPSGPLSQHHGDPACWKPVGKRRRISRFALASGQIVTHAAGLIHEPQCHVELTEIRTPGQEWWSLGFEATGPADLLHNALEGTAALVFAQPLPGGVQPGLDESRSYAEWLARQPGAEGTPASEDHPFAEPHDPRAMPVTPRGRPGDPPRSTERPPVPREQGPTTLGAGEARRHGVRPGYDETEFRTSGRSR